MRTSADDGPRGGRNILKGNTAHYTVYAVPLRLTSSYRHARAGARSWVGYGIVRADAIAGGELERGRSRTAEAGVETSSGGRACPPRSCSLDDCALACGTPMRPCMR